MAALKNVSPPRKSAVKQSFVVSTLPEVAQFFKVAITSVDKWRASGMPGTVGSWDLGEICAWRFGKHETSSLSEEQKAADIRLKNASARSKELENLQTEAELVSVRDVNERQAQALIELREQLMSLPETLAVSMSPDVRDFVRGEADRACREALVAFKRRLDTVTIGDSADADVE